MQSTTLASLPWSQQGWSADMVRSLCWGNNSGICVVWRQEMMEPTSPHPASVPRLILHGNLSWEAVRQTGGHSAMSAWGCGEHKPSHCVCLLSPTHWKRRRKSRLGAGTSSQYCRIARAAKKGWKLSLHKEPHGEDKGQQVLVAPGRYYLDIQKKFLTLRTIMTWNNFPKTMAESLLLELVFKRPLESGLDNLS